MFRELLRRLRPGFEPEPDPVPWAVEKWDKIPNDELRK
ncbi:hypothetical protein M1M38_gp100 [Halorubrum tailed virus 27]|uniref:Uncharacterized protein n=1 Tax=Halorubrum tailed virus 27 TaxID=2878008 RepID=A0AAE9BY69_9CAUD|nr:hypothetical protein M1M38_gp100 [Halorubrum tailed virus 27]UBF22793.1 hypothetical protein HRTV-27_gp100 [Halorubrum tailed virus 27]